MSGNRCVARNAEAMKKPVIILFRQIFADRYCWLPGLVEVDRVPSQQCRPHHPKRRLDCLRRRYFDVDGCRFLRKREAYRLPAERCRQPILFRQCDLRSCAKRRLHTSQRHAAAHLHVFPEEMTAFADHFEAGLCENSTTAVSTQYHNCSRHLRHCSG